jgi:hypothetical protein
LSAPKRSRAERENDLVIVADMYIRGKTQAQMLEHLGDIRDYSLTQQQISYDIKAIHKRWLDSSLVDYDQVKARELARIDRLEQEYWDAWIRSLQDKEVSVAAKTTGKETTSKTELRREGQAGNPRFLDGVMKCIEQRLKIFGLYAPTQIDVSWRQEAEEKGIRASDIFEEFVGQYMAALKPGDGAASTRSLPGSTEAA